MPRFIRTVLLRPVRKFFWLLLICNAVLQGSTAAPAPEYFFESNARVRAACNRYMALDLPGGDALVQQEFMANPHNLMATYVSDYSDFLQLLFNGNAADLSARRAHQDERLALCDRAPDTDPWKLLAKSAINLHWAIIKARYGENMKAAASLRRSYLQVKDNYAAFPQFAPNAMLYGIEESMAGAIPKDYQWLAAMLGIKGDVRRGAARLQSFIQATAPGDLLQEEAYLCHAYLSLYLLGSADAAWKAVGNEATWPARGNLMRLFVKANIALNNRQADAALQALQLARQMPAAANYPIFDFEQGNALLLRLDPAAAGYLNRFATRTRSPLFVKDAWYKQALAWRLQGNAQKASACLAAIPTHGSGLTDADKQAARFATTAQWPHPALLQARLLTDGGYAQQALARLSAFSEASFTAAADKPEYCYRTGRALEETGSTAASVVAYRRAIALGRARHEQYAARAALQLALLFEKQGRKAEARSCFQQCLDMPEHDFQASLDQQAKAGLNRLGA